MPEQGDLKKCGPADANGEVRERIQTNGRCEASNARGDTYGPVSYLAYVPGYLVFGWTGKWDELWAAHATSLLFDGLCLVGLALVGRRFGGNRLAATLAFAWAAYPFTLYASNSNTNDAIMPAFLIFGFWLASSAWARGAGVALAGWTKFAALLLAPLWLAYPNGSLPLRRGVSASTAADDAGTGLRGSPSPRSRRSRSSCSSQIRSTRRASSASAPSASSSTASRRSRSGAGGSTTRRESPTSTSSSRCSRCCSSQALCALAFVPRAPLAAPARGSDGRSPDRLRARADALVLSLHPVVLPLRRLRRPERP